MADRSDEEIAAIRDAAIRRALSTPPQPKPQKAEAAKKPQAKARQSKPKGGAAS